MKKFIAIISSLCIALILLVPMKANAKESEEWSIDRLKVFAYNKAIEFDLDPYLILAQINMESGWDVDAKNFDGSCIGLMQINPTWQGARMEKYGLTDLMDPIDNITCGLAYMSDLYNTYGDIHKALMSYNGGPSYLHNMLASGNYSSSYSRTIVSNAEAMRLAEETRESLVPRK